MANNDTKNKRLKIGAGILIALTLANFLVRLNRSAPSQPSSLAQTPGQSQKQPPSAEKQAPQNNGRAFAVKSSNVAANVLEIDKRLQVLQTELEAQKFELNKLEKPAKAPDLTTPLFLVRHDLFRYDIFQS